MVTTPGFDIYSTGRLIKAYGIIDRPNTFLKSLYFNEVIFSPTETILYDQFERTRKIAPYVAPTVEAETLAMRGYKTTELRPTYVKVKHSLNAQAFLRRMRGEVIAGSMTPEERHEFLVMEAIRIQDNEISFLEEFQCASVLLTGSLTATGPKFGSETYNFGRQAANTVTLSGSTAWGATGVDPLDDVQEWAANVQSVSGWSPSVIVFSPGAYSLFRKSASVQSVMTAWRQMTGNIDLGGIAVGGVGNEAKYVGSIAQFDLYVYQQTYLDDSGNLQTIMPTNSMIMFDPVNAGGTMAYGAIQDVGAPVQASRYPSMKLEFDPPSHVIMTQSAPLPILGLPNATLAATVA